MLRIAVALTLLAATPRKPDGGTPRPDWHSNPALRDDQANALCKAELRSCRHPYAVLVGPPNPCANMGMRCPDELIPKMGAFRWSCGCDPCMNDSECPDAGYCEHVQRCPPERSFTRCTAARPAASPRPCPDPSLTPPRP